MARFYPVYCRRSDGTVEALVKGKRKELNQPTDVQLDQKPDKNGVSDYYREVSPDEAKSLDWRRKLGGMLARELGWKEKSAQLDNESAYMLVAFPENYRLYEHVKKTEKDGKTEVKSKTHAAGGNERQDAYLYGHPEGRRKRYRSPADFFPHLLWLCTDETGDHDNCGCKICSPDDLDDPVPTVKPKVKPDPEFKIESGVGVAKQGRQDSGKPPQLQRQPGSPQSLVPSLLPHPKSPDQHYDLQYNTFMYRSGELVWFSRGAAWGLGAILRRWLGPSNEYHYAIQPLSHPFEHPSPVTKSSNAELRPWLAWSVPRYTYDGLNNMPDPPKYETADWEGMKHGRYGPGDLEVDGSILAAKSVDSSYTPRNVNNTTELGAGVTDTYYDGIFLGAEKIWLGDPLRLATGSGTDILVVHAIVERKQAASSPQQPQQPAQKSVYFVGDVYRLQVVSHNNPNIPNPASPNNNPQLPPRLTQDLDYRNSRSIPTKNIASYWRLTLSQTRIEINDIKGRWYEASLLLPILQQSAFDNAARKGEIQEASLWMNARGDCVNSNRAPSLPKIPPQNLRQNSRREAFGAALPSGAEIRDGVEAPLPENVDPALEKMSSVVQGDNMEIDAKFEAVGVGGGGGGGGHESIEMRALQQGGEQDQEDGGSGLDEFMHLDEMAESAMPGFGKQHDNSQGSGQPGLF